MHFITSLMEMCSSPVQNESNNGHSLPVFHCSAIIEDLLALPGLCWHVK